MDADALSLVVEQILKLDELVNKIYDAWVDGDEILEELESMKKELKNFPVEVEISEFPSP